MEDETLPDSQQQIAIDGASVQKIIFEKLMPAVDDIPMGEAVLAMMTFTVFLMKQDLPVEDLRQIVFDTSKFIVMSLNEHTAKEEGKFIHNASGTIQ